MSCVLEILSIHELNRRKEFLLKQINKIDIEIEKRLLEDNNITSKPLKIKINITKKSEEHINLDKLSCESLDKSKKIKIKITKIENC
jgi:hypothetical protein